MKRWLILAGIIVAGLAAGNLIQVGGDVSGARPSFVARGLDLSAFPATAPLQPIDLLFIHHSVGEQLLAERGPSDNRQAILTRHPNGGGLAALLSKNNYRLHHATYGSKVGDNTDIIDWPRKFQQAMAAVLSVKSQDEALSAGESNRVVLFKSGFENSDFVGAGGGNGNPEGPELTESNARAAMNAIRTEFARHPDTLFVYLTAPPLAPKTWQEPLWKWLAKRSFGHLTHDDEVRESGALARSFNNWVVDAQGWLAGFGQHNTVVFDLFDTLTGHGASNFSVYATGDGWDPHPSSEGNSKAAEELVVFLNRAVRYAEIVQ